jgi:hypothetical protein
MAGTSPAMTSFNPSHQLAHNIKYRIFWIKDRLFHFDMAWFLEAKRSLEVAKNVNELSALHIAFAAECSPRNSSASEFG